MDAVKFKSKILKYIEYGIDDKIILLEMIRATGDDGFIRQCEQLIGLQTPLIAKDLEQKFEKVANKINSLDEHLKDGEDESLIMDLANKHYNTLRKIEIEMSKHEINTG